MTKTSGMGAGAGLTIGAVATVAVVGGGFFLARGGVFGAGTQAVVERQLAALGLAEPVAEPTKPDKAPEPAPAVAAAVPPESAETPANEPASTPVEPAFVLTPPALEVVRFEPDGTGIIAGSAQPGVEVTVLLDDAVLDTQTVPDAGEFVSFVTIEPSESARIVSLVARYDGQERTALDSFILMPIAPQLAENPDATGTDVADAGAAQQVETPPVQTEPEVEPEVVTEPAKVEAADTAAPAPETVDAAQVAVAETSASPEPVVIAEAEQAGTEPSPAEDLQEEQPDVQVSDAQEAKPDVPAVTTPEVESASTADTAEITDPTPATPPEADVESAPEASVAGVAPDEPSTPEDLAVATPEVQPTQTEAQPPQATVSGPETATADTQPEADAKPAPKPEVAVAVLRAGEDGVTLVQPATPVAPELVGKIALDTIGYTETGEVQLAGRARPQALVRVYLDNSPVAELLAQTDGRWSGSLTSVAPGIYTLRLDEIDPVEGKVLSRLETPFKREAPEVLQPALAAETDPEVPAPRVTAVTVQKGDTLWAISQDRYGSGYLYLRVFEANKSDIRDPDLIYPGQIFTLPE